MNLLDGQRCGSSRTGWLRLVLLAGGSGLLLSAILSGCSDDKDTTKLSAAGESCAEAADCESGLSCVKSICASTAGGTKDAGGSAAADAGLDTLQDVATDVCTGVCVYYQQADQCQAFGGVPGKGSCGTGKGKKRVCCDLDKAPACKAPAKCLGAKVQPCVSSGGKAVAGWCGNVDQTCCDMTDQKPCPAPAECFKGDIKGCYNKGGSRAAGGCANAGEMCCAFKPCEAPHKCVDSKDCQPPGVQVAYSCTYPGVCCDKSGGSAADAGGSTDAGTEADAGSSADTK